MKGEKMEQSEKPIPICTPESLDLKVGFSDNPHEMDISSNSAHLGSGETVDRENIVQYGVSKVVKCGKFMWKLTTSQFGLLILLIGYTFLGAAIFNVVEDRESSKVISENSTLFNVTLANISEFRAHFINLIKKAQPNLDGINESDMEDILVEYETALQEFKESKDDSTIDYWSWFLFCLTVYSTIGEWGCLIFFKKISVVVESF